jgi:putative glycosyltransferase (TIGR04372 family)
VIAEKAGSFLRGLFGEKSQQFADHVRMLVEARHTVGNWPLREWLVLAVGLVPLLLVIVVIRLIKPLFWIRFGILLGNRIGHFSGNTDLYLCEKNAGIQNERCVDIFYLEKPICNDQLRKLWARELKICTLAQYLSRVNRLLPGYATHEVPFNLDVDRKRLRAGSKAQVHFTPEEKLRGLVERGKIGINETCPYICFLARDSSYLKSLPAYRSLDFGYHDYRDGSIDNYIPAAYELVRRGYYVIRMGASVAESLKENHPQIIDYASRFRSEFMDIYLSAECRFFLCDTSGMCNVVKMFRRPLGYVNFVPIGLDNLLTLATGNILIPKRLRWRKAGRILSLRESLQYGADTFYRSEEYEELGVEVVENSPDEITALAMEMDDRLDGAWETTEEDEELQREFWKKFGVAGLQSSIDARVSAAFLRKHREWVE